MAGRKQFYKTGEKVGDFRLVRKMRGSRKDSPAIRKKWKVRCEAPDCSNELIVPEMYLRRAENPKTHCGCRTKTLKAEYNNEYRIWLMVRSRTRDPKHPSYNHYFSNGIDICDEWYPLETGFDLFFKDVGKRPSKKHTLDRIDNMRGYEPGNVRWATPTQQRYNQGDRVDGYTEEEISDAGYRRSEFTKLIRDGKTGLELIGRAPKSVPKY